jgi:hypothetical protein
MARTIALFAASPLRLDALTPLRVLLSGTCALALILAGQPLPF